MAFSFANLLIWSAALFALAMLRTIWLSERAHRALERARAVQLASEREFGRARQRDRGDSPPLR